MRDRGFRVEKAGGRRSLAGIAALTLLVAAGSPGCTTPIDDNDARMGRDAADDRASGNDRSDDPRPERAMRDEGDEGDEGKDAPEPGCGNKVVEKGEQCDDGNDVDGDGCNNDCTFSCKADADCDDGDPCNGAESCDVKTHRCQPAAKPAEDGAECTVVVEVPGGGADGGPDGGDGGGTQTFPGRCVEGSCRPSCKNDDECQDGDACNGAEVCETDFNTCVPAAKPLDCDDKLDCTTDSCDPELGCVNELIDGDGDGFAPMGMACDERGGDCNDGDDEVYPGAPELCDGKDNNCIDGIDETAPTWYQDCDGDGYARGDALAMTQCNKPATTPQCVDWTTRTPVGAANVDCDDTLAQVNPGVTLYQNRPYCRGAGALASGSAPNFTCAVGTVSWDYNCVSGQEREFPSLASCRIVVPFGCTGSGFTDTVPACGFSGEFTDCGFRTCAVTRFTRQQRCR